MACALAAAPASAMQILEAADHGELRAQISARAVSRVALGNDRIARVVRAPGGFEVEHDPARGDLYLRPLSDGAGAGEGPVTLFVGTEKGFTYRLTLEVADRGSAQILIRNADATAIAGAGEALAGDPRIAALTALVRAVARREPLPGYRHRGGARFRRARAVHRGRDLARPALRGAGAGARARRSGRCGGAWPASRPRIGVRGRPRGRGAVAGGARHGAGRRPARGGGARGDTGHGAPGTGASR